jgi:ubiquitin-protein ligase
MRESPRTRRLKSDQKSLQQLAAESTIFEFASYGSPPDFYILRFKGRGLCRTEPQGDVAVRSEHEVHVRLGASYPRMMPELAWKSPIFHPNISASGVVCLGGYGTYWVPSLSLDELCSMLWDMIRYENFDEKSPYNREAAGWTKNQTSYVLPIDERPLRDRLADGNLSNHAPPHAASALKQPHYASEPPIRNRTATSPALPQSVATDGMLFLGEVQIIEAEVVGGRSMRPRGDADILFIE